jgi:hypothetical protein
MANKRIPERVRRTTDKYLSSLDTSRGKLTERQWEFIAGHIKRTRMSVLLLLAFGVICVCLSIWNYRLKREYANIVPDEVVFVYRAGSESATPLSPGAIENYIGLLTKIAFRMGTLYVITCFMFFSAFLLIPLERRGFRKILKAFVRLEEEPGVSPGGA